MADLPGLNLTYSLRPTKSLNSLLSPIRNSSLRRARREDSAMHGTWCFVKTYVAFPSTHEAARSSPDTAWSSSQCGPVQSTPSACRRSSRSCMLIPRKIHPPVPTCIRNLPPKKLLQMFKKTLELHPHIGRLPITVRPYILRRIVTQQDHRPSNISHSTMPLPHNNQIFCRNRRNLCNL